MREIQITKGYVALVDDEDYEDVSQYKWQASVGECTVYAISSFGKRPNRTTVRMHRYLTKADKDVDVDHEDGNGLNNQRHNLRKCSPGRNMQNMKIRSDGTSKFKGVCWVKREGAWLAQLTLNYKNIRLGHFLNEEDAALAYDIAARLYFGEFARTNFN